MAADSIDPKHLPPSALLDTSVLLPALGSAKSDEPCKALFDALVAGRKRVLIAAPSLAEILRKEPVSKVPRVAGVEVVSFDRDGAEVLATKLTWEAIRTFATTTGLPKDYFKYDGMIVACAIRHRASVLITTDDHQAQIAKHAGLEAVRPSKYLGNQPSLF